MDTIRNEKVRYYYLDFIKIIAAFMVTFYHFGYIRINYAYDNLAEGWYIPNINRIIMSLCAMSIPLFFMVNGALMLQKDRDKITIFKKVIKILFLTVVWSVVHFPRWFFLTLTILYVITPALRKLYKNKSIFLQIILLFLIIVPFLFNYIVPIIKLFNYEFTVLGRRISPELWKSTGIFTLYAIVYYVLGVYMHVGDKSNTFVNLMFITIGLGMNLLEVVINTHIDGQMFDGVNASFPTFGALLMAVGTFRLCKTIRYGKKFSLFLKKISPYILCIYVLHLFYIEIFVKICGGIESCSVFMALLVSLLVDGLCVLSGMLLNKVPILNQLIKI